MTGLLDVIRKAITSHFIAVPNPRTIIVTIPSQEVFDRIALPACAYAGPGGRALTKSVFMEEISVVFQHQQC